jgi:hypothetical protein
LFMIDLISLPTFDHATSRRRTNIPVLIHEAARPVRL